MGVFIVLYIHNIFYHATFQYLKFYYYDLIDHDEEAIQTLETFNLIRPKDLFPYISKAKKYINNKEFDNANNELINAENLFGETDKIMWVKADLLWNTKDYRQYTKVLESLAENNPDNKDLQLLLSEMYIYSGDRKQGVDKAKKMIAELIRETKAIDKLYNYSLVTKRISVIKKLQLRTVEIMEQNLTNDLHDQIRILPNHEDILSNLNNLSITIQDRKGITQQDIKLTSDLSKVYISLQEYNLAVNLLKEVADKIDEASKLSKQKFNAQNIILDYQWQIINIYDRIIDIYSKILIVD